MTVNPREQLLPVRGRQTPAAINAVTRVIHAHKDFRTATLVGIAAKAGKAGLTNRFTFCGDGRKEADPT